MFSCVTNRNLTIKNLEGFYQGKNGVNLNLKKQNNKFLLKCLPKYYCFGKWKINKKEILLFCKAPNDISEYTSGYTILEDTTIVLKIKNKRKLLLNNKILKKK